MRPSIEALEILATSDSDVFESAMAQIGLTVEGVISNDPLQNVVQSEQIVSIASSLNEDVRDMTTQYDSYTNNVKCMAEECGYIVSFTE